MLEKLAIRLVPDKAHAADKTVELDQRLLTTPAVALERCRVVTCEMAVVEPARLFESMVRGRSFEEVPYIASRVCGICSSSHVVTDLRAANEHYAQYEGKVQDAAQKVNDTYLKAFSEESGVQSYGEAADLLIAWYLKNNA